MNLFDDKKVKEEIDLYLSSLEDKEPEVIQTVNNFRACTKIINDSANPEGILNFLIKYYRTGLLSPLSLNKDEFNYNGDIDWPNKRYDQLVLNSDDEYIYRNAWKPWVVHVYNPITNEEEPVFPNHCDIQYNRSPIWITRGGCCKGEYISNVCLKQSTVDKHSFTPHEPILIPVSVILNGDGPIFSVDAREPKLAALRKFYDTREVVIDYKFDIRKFKKLK